MPLTTQRMEEKVTRRICLLAIATDILDQAIAHLPPGVVVSGQCECFDRAVTLIRVEGDGLPSWCDEPPPGQQYAVGSIVIFEDCTALISPAFHCGDDWSTYDRIVESMSNNN